jgi:tRNA(adenine34) deaminase
MLYALKLADRAAQQGEVPVGAVVVSEGAVLGEGWNQMIASNDPTAHAEILAIRAAASACANYRLPQATLYVTLEPCTMCAGAMIHARIQRLVFAAYEPKSGVICSRCELLDEAWYNHKIEWQGGVLMDQSAAMLQAFFKSRRACKR